MIRYSYTYGVMPSAKVFEEAYHFAVECDGVSNGMYRIRNCKLYGNVDYTCEELYNECKHLVDSGFDVDSEEMQFVSAVLETLLIEWVLAFWFG